MTLFDALSGRIEHFNSIAVPVINNIFSKIKVLLDEDEKQVFTTSLTLAQHGIDLFFKPRVGPVIKDVKKYNKQDFEKLYSIFMIWLFYDLCSFLDSSQRDLLKSKLQGILSLKEDEFNYYYQELEHEMKVPIGLDKLWKEVIKIIHTMPSTEENYFVFCREFAKICKVTYQNLE